MDKATRKRTKTHSKPEVIDQIPSEESAAPEMELFGPDPLAERLRGMIGGLIEELVAEELEAVLGARRYERTREGGAARTGYRHGGRARTISTSLGPSEIRVPRARLFGGEEGDGKEWRSGLLPRYARRTRDVDDAVLGSYLSGANTRRIRGALKPILKGSPLSKSAVSRVVRQLKDTFDEWRTRSLGEKEIVYLYLDAIHVKVRTAGRVDDMPMLVALGVHETGEKEVLGLMLVSSESRTGWKLMVEDLAARGLRAPLLCVIDGSKGLRSALQQTWPGVPVQRCVVHKLRNLEGHCPKHALDELRGDFHAISEAKSEKAAKQAYERFVRLWSLRSEGVVNSIKEGGAELLTHYRFPKSQWKCLRTTNAIERLQEEFRRRIKTQSSLPSESSALLLFFGVVESGQIRMRRLDGWADIATAIAKHSRPDSSAAPTAKTG